MTTHRSGSARPDLDRSYRGPEGDVRARVANGLAAVAEADWDRLVTDGDRPLAYRFLGAWEHCELPGLQSRPVLAFRPGCSEPVGACPGYIYDLDLVGVRLPSARPLLGKLRTVRPRLLMARTYELGNPTPLTNPFLLDDRVPPVATVAALVAEAWAEAVRADASFMVIQNVASLEGRAAQRLLASGFVGFPIMPTGVVDLPYESFEDYLRAMRSAYRRRAKVVFERSRGLHVEHVRDFRELAADAAHLWRLIYKRASEVRREILPAAFFTAAAEVDGCSMLVLRRSDGSMASFALLLSDPPRLSFLQCGFDAADARSAGVYFRLLYEIIRVAIDGGYEDVDLGITTLAPKLDVGAVPVMLYALVRHRNPVSQRLISMAARGPLRPKAVEGRRVFKQPPPSAAELIARRSDGNPFLT